MSSEIHLDSSLEDFRMTEGYEHYQLSNLGRAYCLKTKRFIAVRETGDGRQAVLLYSNGYARRRWIHKLIQQEFAKHHNASHSVTSMLK